MKVKDFSKSYWWIFLLVLIFVIAVFGFFFFTTPKVGNESSENKPISADSLITRLKNRVVDLSIERDTYKAKLDTCENNIQRPLTIEERLAAVEAENARLKSQPVAVVARTPVTSIRRAKRIVVAQDVTETKFQAVTFAAPVVRVSSQMTQASDNNASNAQYKSVFKGAVGTTLTSQRNPIYYVKGSDAIKSAPEWCGDSNKKMSYDTESGYWFYADLNRILSDQELSDPNFFLLWNILTGTVNWGGGSYKTWLPHESIKPLLNSVRGFEYGFITNDDLNQMSQKDSRIWSPSNPAGIYQPLKAEVHERTDANYWQGWNFRTKVNFTRTISFNKVDVKFTPIKLYYNQNLNYA